ncbi:hypothetical protein A2U01_0068603, partial [Trifolium medium]|nr:hypothetical protein [Trifolium medium]
NKDAKRVKIEIDPSKLVVLSSDDEDEMVRNVKRERVSAVHRESNRERGRVPAVTGERVSTVKRQRLPSVNGEHRESNRGRGRVPDVN